MILAIDIGNTNIVIGCIDGKKCLFVEIDLGIAKYHFELGAGSEHFEWA